MNPVETRYVVYQLCGLKTNCSSPQFLEAKYHLCFLFWSNFSENPIFTFGFKFLYYSSLEPNVIKTSCITSKIFFLFQKLPR